MKRLPSRKWRAKAAKASWRGIPRRGPLAVVESGHCRELSRPLTPNDLFLLGLIDGAGHNAIGEWMKAADAQRESGRQFKSWRQSGSDANRGKCAEARARAITRARELRATNPRIYTKRKISDQLAADPEFGCKASTIERYLRKVRLT